MRKKEFVEYEVLCEKIQLHDAIISKGGSYEC